MRPLWSGYRVGKVDGGPQAEGLERELEAYYGVPHARVFNSATSALHGALVAAGVHESDRVLVPVYSMSASATAVLHAGATPVFCDIADDYCLDWAAATPRLDESVAAVVLVHLFGHHAKVPDGLRTPVIHDCAQSPTVRPDPARPGDLYVYSLNQHKIVAAGEGGYVCAWGDRLSDRLHAVRNHGECFNEDIVGWNYRMTEPIAEIARREFAQLDWRIAKRRTWAEALAGIYGYRDPGNRDYFLLPIRVTEGSREDVAARVKGRVGYHRLIPDLPWFAAHGYTTEGCGNAALIESQLVVVDPLQDDL